MTSEHRAAFPQAAYIDPSARIFGAVEIAEHASLWPCAVIRAESRFVRIGRLSNLQDHVMVHVGYHHPTIVGDYCSITHRVVLHGCHIGDNCLIRPRLCARPTISSPTESTPCSTIAMPNATHAATIAAGTGPPIKAKHGAGRKTRNGNLQRAMVASRRCRLAGALTKMWGNDRGWEQRLNGPAAPAPLVRVAASAVRPQWSALLPSRLENRCGCGRESGST